jgi:hypothetical protein
MVFEARKYSSIKIESECVNVRWTPFKKLKAVSKEGRSNSLSESKILIVCVSLPVFILVLISVVCSLFLSPQLQRRKIINMVVDDCILGFMIIKIAVFLININPLTVFHQSFILKNNGLRIFSLDKASSFYSENIFLLNLPTISSGKEKNTTFMKAEITPHHHFFILKKSEQKYKFFYL